MLRLTGILLAVATVHGGRYAGNCDQGVPSDCPEGFICAPAGDLNANPSSQYKCTECLCTHTSQCYVDGTEILCNCSGYGTYGVFCHLVEEVNFVGFTAYLSYFAYNLPVGQPLVLDSVILNEGGAYNPTTGKFTAPVAGFYSFTFSIETKGIDYYYDSNIVVRLVVDSENMLNVVVETRHYGQNLSGSNAGVLKLEKDQEVWLEPYQELYQNIEGGDIYRFTTFSGYLLAKV